MPSTSFIQGPATVTSSGIHGPARTLVGRVSDLQVQLLSTGGDWAAQAGTGNWSWGIEYSSNAGATWRWAVHEPGDGADPNSFPIGKTGRNGILPLLGFGGGNLKDLVGSRLRLAATTIPFSSTPAANPTVPGMSALITVTTT